MYGLILLVKAVTKAESNGAGLTRTLLVTSETFLTLLSGLSTVRAGTVKVEMVDTTEVNNCSGGKVLPNAITKLLTILLIGFFSGSGILLLFSLIVSSKELLMTSTNLNPRISLVGLFAWLILLYVICSFLSLSI